MVAIKEVTEENLGLNVTTEEPFLNKDQNDLWRDLVKRVGALEENHPKTLDLYTNLVQARTLLDEDLGKGKQKLTNIIKMIGRELGQKI